jgi:hypothetical protein
MRWLLNILRYCGLVFRTALHHSVSWAQFIIAIIIIIAGAAIEILRSFGMTIETTELMTMLRSPTFLAMLAGWVIVFRLVCAQYWIWSEEHDARIKAETQVAELSARHILSKNTAHNALSIEFLRDELHEIVQTFPVGTVRRILKVSTFNQGNGWLSNCRLVVEKAAPSIYDYSVELDSGLTLQVGERRYSEFLYFDESFPDGRAAPKVLLVHQTVGFYVEIGFPITQPTIFTLKATSNEARECTESFRAFVENGRLRMEKI